MLRPQVLAERVQARRGDASDATLTVMRRQLDVDLGQLTWLTLTSDADPDTVAIRAKAALDLGR